MRNKIPLRAPVLLAILAQFWLASHVKGQDYQPAVTEIVTSIDKALSRASFKSVAVLGVTDLAGRPTCLGDLLAEEISVGLASGSRSYEIVSRNDAKLKAAIQEQKLGRSGLVDPQTAAHVGQLLGVQGLAMGTVTLVGDNIRLTVSVIDSATARIIGGAAATLPRTKSIEEYMAGCLSPQPAGGASSPSDGGQKPQAKSTPTTVQGFEFDLDSCVRKGGAVTCTFWVTNQRNDRNFFIGSGVGAVGFKAFDDRGNEYSGGQIQVANHRMDPLGVTLLTNVRTKLVFFIEGNVAGDSLARLQFSASGSDVGFFQVVISDLPLTNR